MILVIGRVPYYRLLRKQNSAFPLSMPIKEVEKLLVVNSHHLGQKIARKMLQEPELLPELILPIVEGPSSVAGRASWALSLVAEERPQLVKPHLKVLIRQLDNPDLSVPVKRHLLRLLQFVEIPGKFHARLIDFYFKILKSRKEAIAVHVYAMTVLFRITAQMPELRNELSIMLEDNLPYASAGYRSRAIKILKHMEKQFS
jgi:hypothetical protein